MKIKSILASGALILSLAAIGSARSWDITLSTKTKIGSTMLPAGNYSVKVDKDQAQFVSDTGKKFTVPVKVQNDAKKFEQTEMKTQMQGDTTVVNIIDLGGTNEELQFGE
jgi:hypothetical protein